MMKAAPDNPELHHGSILCATAAVPDLEAALADYHKRLGLEIVTRAHVSPEEAAAWNAPAIAGADYAVLQPSSGAESYIRLVEQPLPSGFRATQTYGWAAFELSVQDAFSWPAALEGSGFEIVGPPRHIAGLDHLIAMQMVGSGQEMIYLNEVRANTPTTDLPKANCPVDLTFICILAARDREAALRWYCDHLDLDESETHTIPYSSINRAFALPDTHSTSLTMVHNDRMPIVEIDGYPGIATERPIAAGHLPPGNAIVSLAAAKLEAIDLAPITPIRTCEKAPYLGRRTATYAGPEGELLELVEIGR
jgi:catechol 2,3-dioxygenase-like lactoylglutathione lyase family enzyme